MNYIGLKNIFFIFIAAVIIGGALYLSQYRVEHLAAAQQSYTTQITPTLGTSTIIAIPDNGNWKSTLLTASTTSWNTVSDDEASFFQPGQTVSGQTDIFSKDLFAQFIAAKSAGEDTSATGTQESIVSQVLSDGTALPVPTTYNKSSLNLSSDNSKAALEAYGNALGTVFNNDLSKNQRNELVIAQDSLDKNDPTILKELDPIIASYRVTIKALLAVKTPSTLADFHISVVNAISKMILADQSISESYTDGIVSLQGLKMYQQAQADLANSLGSIVQDFNLSGVSFQPTEPGSIFTTIK